MAIYTLNTNSKIFAVENIFTTETECATLYQYVVTAQSTEEIDITLSGDHINAVYLDDGIETSFTTTATVNFGTTLVIRFILENSSSPGYFNTATLTVTNNDTSNSTDTYVFTVERENDDITCSEKAASAEEINDLTDAVVWADVPDINITESSVTQHDRDWETHK